MQPHILALSPGRSKPKEDGTQKPIDSRDIAITIQLETNFWRETITWLRNNPERLLGLILIPLVVYFGKKIFDHIVNRHMATDRVERGDAIQSAK